ncbi:MAG TPA: TetR/AcrR family transcriptional regulator [Candidatus Ruania gallistercoris]|uniref:TetR/AcrR family transcriptional regulator n=1 Tax=Candidatus Ruania gallistercoris TaxID=2838746 RepID=A0A9D2EFB8_9MICO|nr:TetR/AcrR family transcriptional regulator [Candidatus Ruania gallistercoris]
MAEDNPLEHTHRLLWEGLPENRKGPRPTLTLEQIVTAGIALADAEGVDALSMRKLSAELGVGTMSLYRYVPNKHELLTLMLDHVLGSQIGRTAPGASWREALTAMAEHGRAMYLRHPWLLQVNLSRPVLGPNAVAQMEENVAGLTELPFGDQETMMVVSAVDAYVTGSVREEILYAQAAAESGLTEDEFWNYQLPVLVRAMESGKFPAMAALSEDVFDAGFESSFTLGLELILDGIEQRVARSGGTGE